MHIQPIAFGVSFNIDLQPQSHWFLFNGTWQKRPGEPDYWLRVEMEYHFFHLHSQSIMEYHFFHLHSHFFHHFYHWSIIYSNGVSFLSLEYHLVSFLSLEYHFYHWSIISIIGVSFLSLEYHLVSFLSLEYHFYHWSIISIIGVSFSIISIIGVSFLSLEYHFYHWSIIYSKCNRLYMDLCVRHGVQSQHAFWK